jgi:hypothetical protein
MERHWWGGWKARLAMGLVVVGLVATLLSALLTHVTPPHLARRTASPTAAPTAAPPPPGLLVPAGWKQALPGLVVSDFGHFNTLVTSAVKPNRVAACALPPHPWPVSVAPVFVLSDDGGRTWQQQAVPLAGLVWECTLEGDSLDPESYAMRVSHFTQGAVTEPEILLTQDAGRTWRLAPLPARMTHSCATLPQQLHMPAWAEAYPCVVDPWDLTHLYAFIVTTLSTERYGLSLYETRDGGTSWRSLHTWPTASELRLMEIHPTSGGLYVVDGQDSGGGEGVYRSADGGATWSKLPLKSTVSGLTYFGQAGRLLTMVYPQLFQVDPVTGAATPLGDVPVIKENNGGVISAVAICEGSLPSLFVSGPYGAYVRSLPLLP